MYLPTQILQRRLAWAARWLDHEHKRPTSFCGVQPPEGIPPFNRKFGARYRPKYEPGSGHSAVEVLHRAGMWLPWYRGIE